MIHRHLLAACALVIALPPLAATADDGPVAAWTFNGQFRRLSREVATDTHHAVTRSDLRHVEAPGLQVIVLDGHADTLRVPDAAQLRMTESVTVDVWVRVERTDTPQPQCVVEKGGERYRIQIGGDTPMFGLKTADSRMDLSGGTVVPGRWHRITGVFERPNAWLYVDGEEVASTTWDHAIGPGRDLNIGSKAGMTYFFDGSIDELRIYREARPPREDEAPSVEPLGVMTVADARLDVTEMAGGVRVDTGATVLELTDDGALRRLAVGGEPVLADNERPLLAASVFESEAWDGWSDQAPGEVVEGTWRADGHEYESGDDAFTARYRGTLGFGDGDALRCELTVRAEAGSPFVTARVAVNAEGDFEDRFIRELSLRLPLALDRRKRIVQGGDRGVQWNTRHFYQFHVSPTQRLMNEPDHNIWRRFAIDQNSGVDYHIWKAESTATPALTMQRGLRAPGWMATYDERAGLLFAYREMARRAPKSLRVQAAGAGEARICLWHEGLPALHVESPQADAVLGAEHTVDLVAFDDEFTFAQPDVALAAHWGVDGLASDPPDRNEPPLDGLNPLTERMAEEEGPLISGGVPLPRGAITDPANVRLQRDGEDMPVQTRALGYWPDGSIKWLLLTFAPEGGEVVGAVGEGETLRFDVTRRDGSAEPWTLHYGGDCAAGTPAAALEAEQDGDVVRIDTGPLQLELAAEEGWLRSVVMDGREVLAEPAGSFVDFLRTDETYPSMTTHAQGERDPGRFLPETIELEEAGPLRAVVKLVGMTGAEDSPRVVVRLEAYQGRTCARIFQSMEMLHPDPRVAFIRRMGIELPLAEGGTSVTAGGQDGPVTLAGGRRAGLRQHSHLGYHAWSQRAGERFVRVDEAQSRSRGWLDLSGAEGGVALVMRDMWQQFPTELIADLEGGRMVAYFWPESLPLIDIRRYSNYPHRSQGESTPANSDWVAESYYERDPIIGVTKAHELLVHFHGPGVDAATIDAVAGDFQRRPLVYCGADRYIDTGVVQAQPTPDTPGFERMSANLDHFARFWMRQQSLWGWYGCWDYGDVQHYYKGGYGWIVPPDDLARLLAGAPEDYEEIDVSDLRQRDYAAPVEWAYDNGRWGWTNTEGLPGLFMQNQYLRTGDRDMFFFCEAMARHVRDVDMRHAGMWLGRGTRHGVQHWSDGNHEERQTTHSEFRHHHYLSGEMRSRDFARLLFDEVYSQQDVRRHAGHSGRLQGLLAWWEMTGSEEAASILRRYVPCFIVDEGLCISPRVAFPEVECVSQDEDVNGRSMFFWTFGGAHGLIEYHALTGHEGLRDAMIRIADTVLDEEDPGLLRTAVAFAALNADDPEPYREVLREHAEDNRLLVQVVPHNEQFYAASRGMLRGSVAGALFGMNDAIYLMAALDGDPELSEERWAEIRRVDAEGGAPYTPPLLSWQSAYDRPDLEEYLRIKHPQP